MSTGSSLQADFGTPVVRHFIACDRIDSVAGNPNYSLINVIHRIGPLPELTYPRIHPSLSFWVQMSDGRGKHTLQIQMVFDHDKSTHTFKPAILDLGNDPLVVYGWPVRLKNLFFERPGLYEFLLLCNGQEIAREPIVLREAQ